MAGPGGRPVGRVSVKVVPDTSTFASSLEAYLQRLENRLRVEIPVSLNAAQMAAAETKLAFLARDRKVKIDVDTSALAGVEKAMGGGGGGRRAGGFFGLLTNPAILGGLAATLGAVFAGLPAMLTSVAAPLGAIALGLDGIKKAAAGLSEPFAAMKTAVSATFEQSLLPVFKELEKVFPTLTTGMQQVARGLSVMLGEAVSKLTSPEGLAMLESIFTNIGKAFTALAPAMGPIVDSFLRLADSGTKAFAQLAPYLAQAAVAFNDFIVWAQNTGVLDAAMRGLGLAIFLLVSAFSGLVTFGTLVFAAIGGLGMLFAHIGQQAWIGAQQIGSAFAALPGLIGSALSSLGSFLGGIFRNAWNAVRTATSTGISNVITFIRGLPGKAASALASLGSGLVKVAKNAWNAFWSEIKRIGASILAWVRDWAGKVISAARNALDIFSPSRAFMDLGKNTMLGFQIGIENNAQGPLDAVTDAMTAVGNIRPTIPAGDLNMAAAGSSVTDMRTQARLNAEALQGSTFKMDNNGDLQLIAAGG